MAKTRKSKQHTVALCLCALISAVFLTVTPASAEMRLSFAVPGVVSAILVKSGQSVKKGAPLARLDRRPYEARLRAARAQLDAAELELGFATDNKKRVQQLFDDLSTSAEELEGASLRVAGAIAARETAAADFSIATWELARATLTAPTNGTVGSVAGYAGLVVDPSRDNVTIITLK